MSNQFYWQTIFSRWNIPIIMPFQSFFQIFCTTSICFSISTFQNINCIHNLQIDFRRTASAVARHRFCEAKPADAKAMAGEALLRDSLLADIVRRRSPINLFQKSEYNT